MGRLGIFVLRQATPISVPGYGNDDRYVKCLGIEMPDRKACHEFDDKCFEHAQYLEILNARRALFIFDPEGFSKGFNIDVEAFLVDKRIGWDRDESEIWRDTRVGVAW